MDILIQIFIMFTIGILAGCIGSILGIGGGMIVTPFLTIVFNLDIKYAIAASIIVVIATSSGAAIAYLKDNVINLRVAMFLEIFTSSGGICGALLSGFIAPSLLYLLFSIFLFYSVINMIIKIKNSKIINKVQIKYNKYSEKLKLNSSYYDKNLNKNINYKTTNITFGSIIMFFAGIASGLLGIGSGVFKVIAMDNVMKMPLKPSTATSNLMMGVTAASSAAIYFFKGLILPQIAVPVSLGVIFGAAIGSKIMPKLHPNIIRYMFVIMMLILCIQMLLKANLGM